MPRFARLVGAIAAALWIVVIAPAAARADERRAVATIDLSADPEAARLRDELFRTLVAHWALRPLDTPGLNDALQGELVDEDRALLDAAAVARGTAEQAIQHFDYGNAETRAREAEQALAAASPAAAAAACSELAFVYGVAQLSGHHPADAGLSFAFSHRLAPASSPDPVRYVPDIVDAYKAAATTRTARVHLEVRGSGEAWIDGVARGAAPGAFEVDTGWHLVQLVAADRITAGGVLKVDRDQTVDIADSPAPPELRVKRARKQLASLPDEAIARAGAMAALAEILHVHDAVLIWKRKDDGKLLVQTWRDVAPGFSALRERGTEPASELLEPLSPAKPPESHVVQVPIGPPIRDDEPLWYQKRWVQASAAGGVIATVVGAILWARHHGTVMGNTNIQFK